MKAVFIFFAVVIAFAAVSGKPAPEAEPSIFDDFVEAIKEFWRRLVSQAYDTLCKKGDKDVCKEWAQQTAEEIRESMIAYCKENLNTLEGEDLEVCNQILQNIDTEED